jgi:hypothetical protein
MQLEAASASWSYLPVLHDSQSSLIAEPGGAWVPMGHASSQWRGFEVKLPAAHFTHGVAGLRSSSNVPGWHHAQSVLFAELMGA